MGPQNHLYTCFCFDLIDKYFFMRAMVNNAGSNMNLCYLLIYWFVPEIKLYQPGHDCCAWTITAIQKPDEFGILSITGEFPFPAVKGHHTP